MKKNILKFLPFTFLLILTFGCEKSQENDEKNKQIEEEKIIIHDIDKLIEDLPSPSLMAFALEAIEKNYRPELVNGIERLEDYKYDPEKLALNMGVYGADMLYLIAFNQRKKSMEYLKLSHRIAQLLGDTTVYDQEHIDKYQDYLENKEKEEVLRYLSSLFISASIQMEEHHHLTIAGLALIGSVIESLYHGTREIDALPDSHANNIKLEPLVKLILDEQKVLKDIYELTKDLPFTNLMAEMITEIAILNRIYATDLKIIEKKMKNDSNYVITKREISPIILEVKRIRNYIVE